jgi:hypothetical protein
MRTEKQTAADAKAAARAEARREKFRRKMQGIRHQFGPIAPAPEPGTVFDPLPLFFDPGFLPAVLAWWTFKAYRAGCGDGLPANLRKARCEQAAQDTLTLFLDRDYDAAGITASETLRAVSTAFGMMRRALFRSPMDHRPGERAWFPFNRAEASKSPNPAAIVAASFNAAEDREALQGDGKEEAPAGEVSIAGGKRRPNGHGKMIRARVVERTTVENVPFVTAESLAAGRSICGRITVETETAREWWKMDRRRGYEQTYRPGTVRDSRQVSRPRFKQTPPPAAGLAGGPHRGLPFDAAAVAELARERMTEGTPERERWIASRAEG